MKISLQEIKQNPLNEIYIHSDIKDLTESIKERGLLEPLLVDQDNLLISGHRRLRALTDLGELEVEVIVKTYDNELDRQQDFLDANKQRDKSTLERMNEAELEEKIESQRAKDRQGFRTDLNILQNFGGSGNTDDIIANKMGIGSGEQYRKLKKIKDVFGKQALIDLDDEGKDLSVNKLFKEIRKEEKLQQAPAIIVPENVTQSIKLGDFRELIKELPDNSVDLVLTDPPYPKEYLELWLDLARDSARVLKPGGFLIAYSGTCHLPTVIESLGKHLNYYYTITLYHKGGTGQNFSVNMWDRSKPIFIYYKEPKIKQETWIENLIESPVPDKTMHEWGQSVEPFIKLLEVFSKPGDTILDPFMGGGVVLEACAKTNRNFIGYEISEKYFNLVKGRIK